MYHISVNNKTQYDVELSKDSISINNTNSPITFEKLNASNYHVLLNNKSYSIECVSVDYDAKSLQLKVNGRLYQCSIKDQFDDLLKQLGLDNLNTKKINEVKAPMPGLVLKVLLEEGQSFQKGDNLIVLEAMKMENILKAPSDGVVKNIKVKSGDKVEKNEVLITLA